MSYDRTIITVGFDVRYATGSGHGAMIRGTWATAIWGEGYGLDLDYLYRSILAGDQHLSLALDVMVGATLGERWERTVDGSWSAAGLSVVLAD